MPYQPIPGTRVGVHTTPKKKDAKVPCVRCGRMREPNHSMRPGKQQKKPSGLCKDCRSTMSSQEIAIWSDRSTLTNS